MDEFALCWNNFADNIASGFQNLYDRGDLVDVTIACDGKLLKAHKIVLAICSPYFQDMFMTNPCKHPIIVLKDVSVNVMQELLQFMYQGEVNVKHSELQSFMKIAETLQIKGLTASHKSDRSATPQTLPAPAHSNNSSNSNNNNNNIINNSNRLALKDIVGPSTSQLDPSKLNSYLAAAAKESLKRAADNSFPPSDPYPLHYPKKALKRSTDSIDQESNSDCMDNLSSDEVFIPTSPQISMIEQSSSSGRQFDLSSVKRENTNDSSCSPQQSPTNLATSAAAMGVAAAAGMKLGFASTPTHHPALHPMFGAFEHNNSSFSGIASSLASITGAVSGTAAAAVAAATGSTGSGSGKTSSLDFSNEYPQDFGKGGILPGHMDIPAGSSITMLSSTSLLHNSCIFNRNNTVATQQGLKTYWLCKSYRVSMCRARCITHHGQVISSTGVHNHPPHMKGSPHDFHQQPPPPPPPPLPPPPAPPPPQPSSSNNGLPHHASLNHYPGEGIGSTAMVNSNGSYLHHTHYHPNTNQPPNSMGPPPHDHHPHHHQFPQTQHHQPYGHHEMSGNNHSQSYQPYDPHVNMQPPLIQQHPPVSAPPPLPPSVPQAPPAVQNPSPNGQLQPPEPASDIKLIQLQPPVATNRPLDSMQSTDDRLLDEVSTSDSLLLPPPPQPPTAISASLSEEQQLRLKTEQLS
ncbi:protein bric-a-brac 2-like [Malaya genurostris]|uniref:protein bric-a-brac 2-like n=1 Tax=Malaya genurostris TaxID=325434 RepID=UPI0026F3D2EE|nr:protein bric-a-brac 2-like [Malaya genurostris]XP_058444214.1 protein bric-a-brac 2-like [Malaya genurostris]XP_058444216.1 protein bric-a-brac 2-like [Malaya genurostris]XP_058444217.1 protein bric-a-brac 2-like [Malaya genurostris]